MNKTIKLKMQTVVSTPAKQLRTKQLSTFENANNRNEDSTPSDIKKFVI